MKTQALKIPLNIETPEEPSHRLDHYFKEGSTRTAMIDAVNEALLPIKGLGDLLCYLGGPKHPELEACSQIINSSLRDLEYVFSKG